MPNSIASLNATALTRDVLQALLPEFLPLSAYTSDFTADYMPKGANSLSVNSFAATAGAEFTQASTTYAISDLTSSARTVTPTILYEQYAMNELSNSGTPIEWAAAVMPNAISAVVSQCWAKITALVTAANYSSSLLSTAVNFDADDLAAMDATLDTARASRMRRSLVIKPTYKQYLTSDNSIQNVSASGNADAIRDGLVRRAHGFDVFSVNGTIPANGEALEGWAAAREAVVMAARMPFLDAGAAATSGMQVAEVTEPITGLPIQTRFWFDAATGHYRMWAGTRFGAAVGHGATLVRIRSA